MLRTDLQAIGNAFRAPEGRKALLGFVLSLVGMGFGALAVFGRIVESQAVKTGLLDGDPTMFAAVAAMLLVLPLLVALTVAFPAARHELFSAPYTPFLHSAPVTSFRLVCRVFFRTLFTCSVFQLALGGPPALLLAAGGGTAIHFGALVALPLAAACVSAPLVALVILGQVLRGRYLSGPRLGAVFQVIGVTLALAITGAFILGIFSSRGTLLRMLETTAQGGQRASFLLEAPLAWLAGAMAGTWPLGAMARSIATTVVVVPVLWFAARPLRAAYDRVLSSTSAGIGRRIVGGARNWPRTPLRSMLRKDALAFVQERSGLVFTVFFICAQVAVLKTRLYRVTSTTEALETVQHTSAMLMAMHGVLALFAGIHCLSLAGGEQKQLPLLATAPVSVRTIVRGKMLIVVWPFVLSPLAVAIGAIPLAGAPLSAVLCFLPVAACIAATQTGIVLAIGTRPSLLTVDPNVPLGNSLRTILPALVGTGAVVATLFATRMVAKDIRYGYRWPDEAGDAMLHYAGALTVSAIVAIAIFLAGVRIARRNMRVALRPADAAGSSEAK